MPITRISSAVLLALGLFAARSSAQDTLGTLRSRHVATMSDSTFWPEGVDFDAKSGSYFLASVRHGTIAELRADGTVRELWGRHRADIGAVMSVRVDAPRGVLWATMSGIPQRDGFVAGDTMLSALLKVRASDGAIVRRWNVPIADGGHVLGDLAVSATGDVFVTDSRHPVLYRLRGAADTLETIRHPFFASLQGVAPTTDGNTVYLADYRNGLLAMELATGVITKLAGPTGIGSRGIDGIVLDGTGAIIGVQNGASPARIVRFSVNAERNAIVGSQVLHAGSTEADEPTIGTMAHGRFVYVANSQWEKYDDHGRRRPGVPLTAPLLLGIDIDP